MGNNEKDAESPEFKNSKEPTESAPSSSEMPVTETENPEGLVEKNLLDPVRDNSELTENPLEAEKETLNKKPETSGKSTTKKRIFTIKTITFLLITGLGSTVYFLIKERKEDLHRIQNQLARLDAQVQSLQPSQKDLIPSSQNQPQLQVRLQELESTVKQLASQILEVPTSPEENLSDVPVEMATPDIKGENESKTASLEATDGPIGKSSVTVEEVPETEPETAEEKFKNVKGEDASVLEDDSADSQEDEKETIEKPDEESSEKVIDQEVEHTVSVEVAIESTPVPETQENIENEEEAESVKIEKPQILATPETKSEATPVEIARVFESKAKPEKQIPFHSSPELPRLAPNSNQTLHPGAKRYVEFVELIAEKTYQLAQKGFDASVNFFRKFTE